MLLLVGWLFRCGDRVRNCDAILFEHDDPPYKLHYQFYELSLTYGSRWGCV